MSEERRAIYFNEPATAWPKAPGVVEAVAGEMTVPPAARAPGQETDGDVRAECRTRLAKLLGVPDPSRIVLTAGATSALSLGIHGLRLPRGAVAVTSCAEHHSVLRPLYHLQERGRLHLRIVGLDARGEIDREAFAEAMRGGVSLVALTHASNVTGKVFEVATLFLQAKAYGAITLLNACQSLGLVPVPAEELHADLVAFGGHRGLRGPVGTGGLFVSPHLDLSPRAGEAAGQNHRILLPQASMPLCLEPGTPNLPLLRGLGVALRWWEEAGLSSAREAGRLSDMLRAELRRVRGVQVFSAGRRATRLPIISFRLGGWRVSDLAEMLRREAGIYCRAGLHCSPLLHKALGTRPEGTVRFGLSGMNTEEEVELAVAAVRACAAGRRVSVAAAGRARGRVAVT
jgi:cysteine desulfurase/selenocysteine lyase